MSDDEKIQEWEVEPAKHVVVNGKEYVIVCITGTVDTFTIELEDELALRTRLSGPWA